MEQLTPPPESKILAVLEEIHGVGEVRERFDAKLRSVSFYIRPHISKLTLSLDSPPQGFMNLTKARKAMGISAVSELNYRDSHLPQLLVDM